MKDTIKDAFSGMFDDQTIIEQFFEILDLPDEEFKNVYPKMKRSFEQVFNSPQMQAQVLSQLSTMPNLNSAEEKASGEEFIKEIEADDSLSTEKKDLLISLLKSTISATCDLIDVPREKIPVKVMKIDENAIIPTYAHPTDAGADVYAIKDTTLKPHKTEIIPTGLKFEIPVGYEIQIRPRSGLSATTTLRIANSPATIDADYRGEIGVIMENTGNLSVTIEKGQKIAQLVIAPTPMIKWVETNEISSTSRGEGGFGSTDKG